MKKSRSLALNIVYAKLLNIILLLLILVPPTITGSSYNLNPNFILPTGLEAVGSSQPNLAAQCVHSPLYPQAAQSVNITARALNGTGQAKTVDSIDIFINNNVTIPIATIRNDSTLNYTVSASTDSPIISYNCRVLDNGTSLFSGWKMVRIETRAIPIIYSGPPNTSLDIVFIADNGTYSGPSDPNFLVDVEKAIQMYYNETMFL